jgi:hypothetical protein
MLEIIARGFLSMRQGRCRLHVWCCLLLPLAAAAAPEPPRLVYAEPLSDTWERPAQARAAGIEPAAAVVLTFAAFGRDFRLALAPNARLPAGQADHQALAGALDGEPASWARLTRRGTALIGLVYDGSTYYAIEPAAELAPYLDPALHFPEDGNLIYRLADLLFDPQLLACEAVPAGRPVSAAEALAALAAELPTGMAAALSPERQVRLAPVADYEFALRYGTGAESEIAARLNMIDGIFAAQAGVHIAAGVPTVFRSTAAPYPFDERRASLLLELLSDYRDNHHDGFGLTHLFSNKNLTGTTSGGNLVGIAWQGSVCYPREGAALSTSAGLTRALSTLVAAHEIGHNFGAPHDGESGSPCQSTPQTFLMAPRINGSSTLSACSIVQMEQVLGQAVRRFPSCLTLISDFDVRLDAPARLEADPDATVTVALHVQNLGMQAATGVSLRLTAPAGLVISGVSQGMGFCDDDGRDLSCDLPLLAAGASWPVTVQLDTAAPGTFRAQARVAAAVDRQPGNDAVTVTITVGDPRPPASGGGGGSAGWSLLALLALAGARSLTRR